MRALAGWKMSSMEEAIASLESGTLPLLQVEDYMCILQECSKEKDAGYASCLHTYMSRDGLDTCPALGNDLVFMLAQVGQTNNARLVFSKLEHPNQSSWSSLITGHINCGEVQEAFNVYHKIRLNDGLYPSGAAVVALLKGCARLKDLEIGSQIHADITEKGCIKEDAFVRSTLVNMYAKCGSLTQAHELLEKLSVRDAVSWTALILGYVEHGRSKEALACLERMQREGVLPDKVTYACSLKACASIKAMETGEKIHRELCRHGLQRHPVVGNTLVDMYLKFGSLFKARDVFDSIENRTVVSWTALIAGYADRGCNEEALNCLEEMQRDGMPPDLVTFVCSLKACGSTGDIEKGREIHAMLSKRGLESIHTVSTLVDVYAKNGLLVDAQNMFDTLPARDVVLWTALIAGYVEHGYGEEALQCFEQMQEEGITPDAVMYVCALKACGSTGARDEGEEIHMDIMRTGLDKDYLVGNALIDMYSKFGLLPKAREVFDKIVNREVVSWTALMTGLVEHGHCDEVVELFEQMHNEGVSPDVVSFICNLKACGGIKAARKGEIVFTEAVMKGLEGDLFVGSTLVDMYAKCGLLLEARDVFDKLKVQNMVVWTVLIGGLVEQGLNEEALACCRDMEKERVPTHAVTYLCALKACGSLGSLDIGKDMHTRIVLQGLEAEILVGNTLLDMYAKCGLLMEAHEIFGKLVSRDEVSWNSLISGYSQLGEIGPVSGLLQRMAEEGIKPGLVTFVGILNVCGNAGLVDEGQAYFVAMKERYGAYPTVEHSSCIVDLLGRAGLIDAVVVLIKKMPFLPCMVLWHTLLGACRKWGHLELGRQAFEHAMVLDETDISAYVSVSNIYVDADT